MIPLTAKALREAGYTESAARKIVKLGVPIGGQHVISVEDLEKEYARAKANSQPDVLASAPIGENRMEGDGNPTGRSAKESVGLGRNPRRSRKAVQKPHLHAVVGGAEDLDVSEVRK